MSSIKRRDTAPEKILRKEPSRAGIKYRLHTKDLLGKPDIVMSKMKIAIFCDCDFWHGKKWLLSGKKKFNVRNSYWSKKIEGNIARDKKVNQELRKNGWTVLRFWESDIKDNPAAIVEKIISKIKFKALQMY